MEMNFDRQRAHRNPVTTIAVLGTPISQQRLAAILDAAVVRLGLTEVVVVADTEMDAMACAWNLRRYKLTRYWGEMPRCEVALVFGAGSTDADRVIYVDAAGPQKETR